MMFKSAQEGNILGRDDSGCDLGIDDCEQRFEQQLGSIFATVRVIELFNVQNMVQLAW